MTDHDAVQAVHAAAERGAPAYLSELTQAVALLLRRSRLGPAQTGREEATGPSDGQAVLPYQPSLEAAYGRSTADYTPMPAPNLPRGAADWIASHAPRLDHSTHATSNPEERH